MKGLHVVSWILLVIGGLNWGILGVTGGTNVVGMLGSTVATIVYVLVGLAAIVELFTHKKNCTCCKAGSAPSAM